MALTTKHFIYLHDLIVKLEMIFFSVSEKTPMYFWFYYFEWMFLKEGKCQVNWKWNRRTILDSNGIRRKKLIAAFRLERSMWTVIKHVRSSSKCVVDYMSIEIFVLLSHKRKTTFWAEMFEMKRRISFYSFSKKKKYYRIIDTIVSWPLVIIRFNEQLPIKLWIVFLSCIS